MRLAILAALAALCVTSAVAVVGPAPDRERDELMTPLTRKAPHPIVVWLDGDGSPLAIVHPDGRVEPLPGARTRPRPHTSPSRSRLSRLRGPVRRASGVALTRPGSFSTD